MDFSAAISQVSDGQMSGIAAFDAAEAAPGFSPVPPGVYTSRILRGEITQTKSGVDAYRMRFEISEGEQTGRIVIRTWTFTAKAMPYAKRDLAAFGLTTSGQLLSPFPEPGREYFARLVIAVQRGDDGVDRNDIKRIELVRIVESPAAAFLLPRQAGEGGRK